MAQLVQKPPTNAGDTKDMGWKDPLEEETTTRFSIFLQAEFQGQKSLAGYSQ